MRHILKHIQTLSFVAMTIATVMSCAHSQKASVASIDTNKGMGNEKFQYFYLEALRQQALGHYTAAFDLFRHCQEIDSMQADLYYQIAPYYAELKQDSLAQCCLNRAVALNNHNDNYNERLAQWYIQTKDYDQAIVSYEYLWENNHSRTDVLELLLQLYQQKKSYNKMLSVIERIEQTEGNSENITLSKVQVYQMKGDKEEALKALKSLSDEHPNDANYKVMMGNWLLQNDRTSEARDIFMQAEKDEPNNEYVAASLYDFYRQQGEDSLTAIYRDRILLNKHTESKTKITMMQQIIRNSEEQGGDSTEVLRLFQNIMEVSPEDADIAQLNAIYIQLKQMPQEDIDAALSHVIDVAPDNASARLQLIQNKWKQENWDEIITLTQPGLEFNADNVAFYYLLGIAYYQKDNLEEALETFQRGARHVDDGSDKELVSDIYTMMGDILYKLKRNEESYAAYDSCLQWKPDNYGALNNYAYYLCENHGDMKRAETMSHKTIIAEPENSTFLDTYAWILFQQERYLEAKQYIDRAIEYRDTLHNNATIFDHAGDIYLLCDDRKTAIDHWKKALDEGSGDADIIRKKIKKHEK